jgi:hypothetical protein
MRLPSQPPSALYPTHACPTFYLLCPAAAPAGATPFRPSAGEVFLLSALAKAGATVLTYPMLTIKTRLYTARKGDKEMQYAGIVDAAAQILRREGMWPAALTGAAQPGADPAWFVRAVQRFACTPGLDCHSWHLLANVSSS